MARLLNQLNTARIRLLFQPRCNPLRQQSVNKPPETKHQPFYNLQTTRLINRNEATILSEGPVRIVILPHLRNSGILNSTLKVKNCRQFHLSTRKDVPLPPILWIIVSFTSKVTAVATGRYFFLTLFCSLFDW